MSGTPFINIKITTKDLTSGILTHRFGSASIDAIRKDFAFQHAQTLHVIEQGNSEDVYLKVVDHAEEGQISEGTMIAWAHWILPEDKNRPVSSGAFRGPAPWGLNRAFCVAAVTGTKNLRTRVLKGRKAYVLNQLFTLPEHQRRGAGGMPLTWPVERAAKEGIVCYLDTELDGEVMKMYEKRGFVVVDRFHIDLKNYGIDGDTYTHVAMIKEPATSGENEIGGNGV